jgi:hypothetical protein
MTGAYPLPDSVHFVGSIALDRVEDVFHICGSTLGKRLKRIPDGEPGPRRQWISFQYPMLMASPYLVVSENQPQAQPGAKFELPFKLLRIADGVKPEDVSFGELGYAREARASYLDFKAAQASGDIASGTRFMVALPTPLAVVGGFCAAPDMPAIERAYEAAMLREGQAIVKAIPHNDLCIQWDLCNEMVIYDGQFPLFTPPYFKDIPGEIASRMKRLCDAVPGDVELGIHLCYGDFQARHFVEPKDMAKMVGLANLLSGAITHPLAFIHMPVPINRHDDAFFEPLRDLHLKPGTELILGLVHADGAEATKKRIATAHKFAPTFGIATECGIARARRSDLVRSLIQIHADVSRLPA